MWRRNKINMKRVKELAESDIDSEFFLLQFSNDPQIREYHSQLSWKPLACVLVERGVPNSEKVKLDMLMWMMDINWPGVQEIADFITANASEFEQAFRQTIKESIEINDGAWYSGLMYLLYQCYNARYDFNEELDRQMWDMDLIFENGNIEAIDKLVEEMLSKVKAGTYSEDRFKKLKEL